MYVLEQKMGEEQLSRQNLDTVLPARLLSILSQ